MHEGVDQGERVAQLQRLHLEDHNEVSVQQLAPVRNSRASRLICTTSRARASLVFSRGSFAGCTFAPAGMVATRRVMTQLSVEPACSRCANAATLQAPGPPRCAGAEASLDSLGPAGPPLKGESS